MPFKLPRNRPVRYSSVPQQAAGAGPSTTRSHLPLIIALNIVLIAAIGLVLYFVLKR